MGKFLSEYWRHFKFHLANPFAWILWGLFGLCPVFFGTLPEWAVVGWPMIVLVCIPLYSLAHAQIDERHPRLEFFISRELRNYLREYARERKLETLSEAVIDILEERRKISE